MDYKNLHRGFALLSFLIAAAVYMMTVQPSVPFWDCGEFSAAAIWQQVPHPPGAPLFLMIGKIFHFIIPFGDAGWRLNLVSVFSSAATVWILYLITVKVLNNLRKDPLESMGDALAVYGGAFVGAMALTFSDTFWFNAVESEVYAMSTLFVAILLYLMMKWNEVADEPGHERYLLIMAYIIGLSIGVHLLAVLTTFSIVFLVYFRKYTYSLKSFLMTTVISLVSFFIIYPGIVKWIPALLSGHSPMKNAAHEYLIQDSLFLSIITVGVVVAAAFLLWRGLKTKSHVLNLVMSSFLLMILGYTTYTQILIRSNANSPMNENEPKNMTALTSYLGREQYGDDPFWPRRVKSDGNAVQFYEEYGKWHAPERVPVYRSDGTGFTIPKFKKVNFAGEMTYLWRFQINHMYMRYFYWNFVGRNSDVQDANAAWFGTDKEVDILNYNSSYKSEFPIRFFAIPLIFGLIGLFYHFNRDPKMAFIFMISFLMMGVLAAIAQQQQRPQPRERDYFYTGSFIIWAMWIGMGVHAIIDMIKKKKVPVPIAAGVMAVSILVVPINMAIGGWNIHSRADDYIPFDYSYNILQSTAENAILFTNGDNDTFPLWYLQDVAGVRRDVRVVNLSLGNTLWYVDQLKNRMPWGTDKIPLSFGDDSLRVDDLDKKALSYDFGVARNISIKIKKEILAQYTDDQAVIDKGTWDFQFVGKNYTERDGKTLYLYRVQDKLVLDILREVKLERPIYFSNTVGPDAYCGLEPYFRYEGMAMRICPVRQKVDQTEPIHSEIMYKNLMEIDNSDNYHTEPHYGFKFRNLNNNGVYYDEVHRRLMITYRHLYSSYASYAFVKENDPKKAIAILDKMDEHISLIQFPISFDLMYRIASLYEDCGDQKKADEMYDMTLKSCKELIANPKLQEEIMYYESIGRYIGPYRNAASIYEARELYTEAIDVMSRFKLQVETMYRQSQGRGNGEEIRNMSYVLMDIEINLSKLTIKDVEKKEGKEAALKKAYEIRDSILSKGDDLSKAMAQQLGRVIAELEMATGQFDQAVVQ